MATRYHISDSGTPAVCRAKTVENCPKTKAGDGFHGDLAEATLESEKRFEQSYGSTVTLSSKEKKDQWNKVARKLYKLRMDRLWIRQPMEEIDAEIAQGLAESHGVSKADVTIDEGDPHLSNDIRYRVREKDGTERVYGDELVARGWTIKYLGVQHPKVKSRVIRANDGKSILDAGIYPSDSKDRGFSYATATIEGHGEITFTIDRDGLPSTRQVWDFIDSSKLPGELETDEQLRAAIANNGVIRD